MKTEESKMMLESMGLRATPNRVLVVAELLASDMPLSMADLEERLGSVDKSSVHRVLTLLTENGLLHALEDGRGVVCYELCRSHADDGACSMDDIHPHFYCEVCHRTTCITDVYVPLIAVPEGYEVRSLNYMLKGVCPSCAAKHRH